MLKWLELNNLAQFKFEIKSLKYWRSHQLFGGDCYNCQQSKGCCEVPSWTGGYKFVEQILSKDGTRVHIQNICLVRPNSKLLDSMKREIMNL